MKKTVFITITRGFIVRNILRSGTLDYLKKAGFRIVVFFASNHGESVPSHLKEEFDDEKIIFEVAPVSSLRGHSRFAKLTSYLMSGDSMWTHSQVGNKRNRSRAFFWKYLEFALFWFASKFGFLKALARLVERKIFDTNLYEEYFNTYRPDVVFATSIQTKLDIDMLKEAKKRNIPTIAMPKGWDNATRQFYRFVPDILLFQNERMKKEGARAQKIDKSKIEVTGFPQFDWYRRPEILVSREEFCAWYKLDPKKKIIFFGSEGIWAPDDTSVISLLAKWVNAPGVLGKDSQLFIRPHFTDVKSGRLKKFNEMKNVVVDGNITVSDFFGDNWDPGTEETKKFTNLIFHCDMLVTAISTLVLDAVCFDKPLLFVSFDVLRDSRSGKDLSHLIYEQDHIAWVLETGAVDLARSENELLDSVNTYLVNPSIKQKERELLLKNLCYKVDGKSSERIADILIKVANANQRISCQ